MKTVAAIEVEARLVKELRVELADVFDVCRDVGGQ